MTQTCLFVQGDMSKKNPECLSGVWGLFILNNDMIINIHVDINMNVDITPPTPTPGPGAGMGWGWVG